MAKRVPRIPNRLISGFPPRELVARRQTWYTYPPYRAATVVCSLFNNRIGRSMRLLRLLAWSTLVLTVAVNGRVVQRTMAADELQKVDVEAAKPNRPISFRDRLVVGLQARLKSEVAFVDALVVEVQAGHIPERLVDQTFFWARQRAAVVRNGRTNRPIIYFEPAMRARANLLHVSL
jgi:hypothetical protein